MAVRDADGGSRDRRAPRLGIIEADLDRPLAEADSLDVVELVVELEDQLGIVISDDETDSPDEGGDSAVREPRRPVPPTPRGGAIELPPSVGEADATVAA